MQALENIYTITHKMNIDLEGCMNWVDLNPMMENMQVKIEIYKYYLTDRAFILVFSPSLEARK